MVMHEHEDFGEPRVQGLEKRPPTAKEHLERAQWWPRATETALPRIARPSAPATATAAATCSLAGATGPT
jgi:hypothetical protein